MEAYTINVFVSGSEAEPFCKGSSRRYEFCRTRNLARGMARALGPWFVHADPDWAESVAEQNWVWMSLDRFLPAVQNSDRWLNGGAGTLAHELGHYLGLMHTHQAQTSSKPCDGDGFDYGDEVPDTPASQNGNRYHRQKGLDGDKSAYLDPAAWCADFRKGSHPDTDILRSYDSCPAGVYVVGNYIDPIYNVMSYIPDACRMTFTPNQVSRLQEMVTKYRPKMVAKYSI